MPLLTQTAVYIDNEKLTHFTSYHLTQGVGQHHVFTLRCRADTFDRFGGSVFETSKYLLGKSFSFSTSSIRIKEPTATLSFSGVITQLVKEKSSVHLSELVITAHSPTIMLEGGAHYASYTESSLANIVKDLLSDCDAGVLPAHIAPNYDMPLPYSVQHRSNWAYLCRLASQYGEWLYYDGAQLVFGAPPVKEEFFLKQQDGLISYAVDVRPIPNRQTFFAADYNQHETYRSPGYKDLPATSGLLKITGDVGDELYPTRPQTWAKRAPHDAQNHELDLQAMAVATAGAQATVRLTARSSNPGASLGRLVNIEADGFDAGVFRITEADHYGDFMGNYENSFEGISYQLDVYPLTNLDAYPRSESQVAVVRENDDPQGIGRVRVQFAWQEAFGGLSPWIRVATLHAGPDKGIYFLPEIDEEVMVNFEGGNAEKPFVTGSLYNGKQAATGLSQAKNSVKTIRSRSGHTLELDDTEGAETFRIYDRAGSVIEFIPENKTLTVQAVENLNLAGKNIKLQAEEEVTIEAGSDLVMAAKRNATLYTKGDAAINAEGSATLAAQEDVMLSSAANIEVDATAKAIVAGQDVTIAGKASAEVQAAQTNIKGNMTTIQGATGKTDYT